MAKKLVSLVLVAAIGGAGVGNGGLHFTAYAQYEMEWELSQMEDELRFGNPTLERQEEILTRLSFMKLDLTLMQRPRGYDERSQLEGSNFFGNLERRISDLKMWTESSVSYMRLEKDLKDGAERRESIDQLFGSFMTAGVDQSQVASQPQNGSDSLFDLTYFMSGQQGFTDSFDPFDLSHFDGSNL